MCMAIALDCFETPHRKHQPISQYDGASDDAPSNAPLYEAGITDDGGPFKQITLVGPNLLEAWNRLSFTRNLESSCLQSSTWTPSQPGGSYVYHGTAEHLAQPPFISSLASRPFRGLQGTVRQNQITPAQKSLPILWTSFSPFRAFLWAVFAADIVRLVPGPSGQHRLTSSWQCGDRTYYGVVVIQFSSIQPNPPGCTSFTIPIGKEGHWMDIARAGATTTIEPSSALSKGSEWPDLMHGLEPLVSRQNLGLYIKQFWRTVWFGGGIEALNCRHQQSLAIRYFLEPDSPAPPYNNPGDDKTRGGTLKHRLSGWLKKIVDLNLVYPGVYCSLFTLHFSPCNY
jgi:hypothetical protein